MMRVIRFFGVVLMLLSGTLVVARRDEPEQWIAFISDRDGNAEIYRMRPDGRDVQQLTHTDENNAYCWMRWSANGKRLYVRSGEKNELIPLLCQDHLVTYYFKLSVENGNLQPIYLIPIDESQNGLRSLYMEIDNQTGDISIYSGDEHFSREINLMNSELYMLSPNGKWIAYLSTDYQLYIMKSSRTEGRQLNPDDLFLGLFPTFTWSPDSQWIIFGGTYDQQSMAGMLFRIQVENSRLELLNENVGVLEGQRYSNLISSPDGKWIAFKTDGMLQILSLDGRELRQLSQYNSPEFIDTFLSWSPDSRWIVFSKYDEAGRSKIWRIHPDGTGLEQLTFGPGEDLRPAWSPVIDKAWNGWGLMGIGAGLVMGVGCWRRWQ